MPTTRREKLLFGVIMSLSMTYGMEVYNSAIRMGYNLTGGRGFSSMTNAVLAEAAKETVFMAIVVFIVSELWGNKMGARFALEHTDKTDNKKMCQLFRQAGTVAVMCPTMSLIATIVFQCVLGGEPVVELPAMWIGTLIKNFPMAFFLNMFFAAPFTRWLYGMCMRMAGSLSRGGASVTEA